MSASRAAFGLGLVMSLASLSASGQSIRDAPYIGSHGASGRALYVGPAADLSILPGFYSTPPIPTPPQEDTVLTPRMPLVVTIPLLQQSAMLTDDTVDYVIDDGVISVRATREWFGVISDTIYDDNEYMLPIGSLNAGDYRLDLEIVHVSHLLDDTNVETFQGFTTFRVKHVPEPCSIQLFVIGFLFVIGRLRSPSE